MKINVSELEGRALDWAVAKAVGQEGVYTCPNSPGKTQFIDDSDAVFDRYIWHPSSDWSQSWPLIKRYNIGLVNHEDSTGKVFWAALCQGGAWVQKGYDPLVCIARAIVAAELGPTVDIPDELMEGGGI